MNSKLANNNQDCIPINFCVRTITYVHLFPEDVCLCQLKKKSSRPQTQKEIHSQRW